MGKWVMPAMMVLSVAASAGVAAAQGAAGAGGATDPSSQAASAPGTRAPHGPAMGPGMMGGHGMGHGMMGGYGMGHGMMCGYDRGPAMMGGHGMGHGMMGGYGMGPGMRGGYGPGMSWGSGLGAHGALGALNLTAEQQEKIGALHEEQRRKSWNALGQLRSEQFRLRQMFNADKVDANAVVEQQKKIDELRQQMLRLRVETHNQIHSVLTSEQRQQLRQLRPWWREEG